MAVTSGSGISGSGRSSRVAIVVVLAVVAGAGAVAFVVAGVVACHSGWWQWPQ